MATAYTIFVPLSETLNSATLAWADIPNTIIIWLLAPITAGLSIKLIWEGYAVMRGAGGRDHLLDVFFGTLRVFFVVSLGLTGGMYTVNVVGLVTDFRESMTFLFTSDPSIYAALDNLVNSNLAMIKKVVEVGSDNISLSVTSDSDFTGVLQILVGLAVFVIVAIFTLVAAASIMIIDISLAVVFAIGPLFVACLAFAATVTFFNSWLSTVLKFVLTALILAAITAMANKFVGANITAVLNADNNLLGEGTKAVLGITVLVYLTLKGGGIAGDLIGSAAMNIAAIAKGLKDAAGAAGKGVKMAGQGAAAAGKGAAAAYGAAQSIGRNSSLGQRALQSTAGMRASRGAGSITGSK